ncbi:hypothetical protein NC652_021684 [Populus alba x Populus x berolinensis]|uniref:Uncharacterized protein n=1 Tax=Populus alba x Populus x berolinensis TaxID=444605 RepID=A0AAD6MNL4_9ROSI|nr:hypothetical protein NC652_021684 [Populus alba x Populus x berolinensis]KAJ6988544.1 hypothetical protein NC653_021456 [Populus alba x Populus x berolinensis]
MASLQRKRLLPVNQEEMLIWNWVKCKSNYRRPEREGSEERFTEFSSHQSTTRETLVLVHKIGSSWYF